VSLLSLTRLLAIAGTVTETLAASLRIPAGWKIRQMAGYRARLLGWADVLIILAGGAPARYFWVVGR
jgi:hypothetical protein